MNINEILDKFEDDVVCALSRRTKIIQDAYSDYVEESKKQAKEKIICLIGSDNSDEIVIKFLEEYKDKMFWSRKQVLYAFHQWLVKRLQ